jgi:hypothetical protein
MTGDDEPGSWDEVRSRRPVDEAAVAAYERLMEAEELLYKLWEQRATVMDWIGEALRSPGELDGIVIAELGRKVAALGGHLELVAVLPDGPVTLCQRARRR